MTQQNKEGRDAVEDDLMKVRYDTTGRGCIVREEPGKEVVTPCGRVRAAIGAGVIRWPKGDLRRGEESGVKREGGVM